MINKTILRITTTGTAGNATGSATTEETVSGFVVRVDVNYHASAPATTDFTLAAVNEEIATNIVSLTNNVTDTQLFPTVQLTDNAGTGLTYDGTRVRSWFYPVADELTASLSQCDALTDAAVVEIYWME